MVKNLQARKCIRLLNVQKYTIKNVHVTFTNCLIFDISTFLSVNQYPYIYI